MSEKRKRIVTALIVGITLFIWSNSMVSKESSAQVSNSVAQWQQSISNIVISKQFIRKAAHFCEYGALGFAYGIKFRQGSKTGQWVYNYTMAGLATAVIDEAIQILSGRGPMVADVLLDFVGFVAGFAVLQLLARLIFKRKQG